MFTNFIAYRPSFVDPGNDDRLVDVDLQCVTCGATWHSTEGYGEGQFHHHPLPQAHRRYAVGCLNCTAVGHFTVPLPDSSPAKDRL